VIFQKLKLKPRKKPREKPKNISNQKISSNLKTSKINFFSFLVFRFFLPTKCYIRILSYHLYFMLEIILIVGFIVVIIQLSSIIRGLGVLYDGLAIMNNNIKVLLEGFKMILRDEKEKEEYQEVIETFNKMSEKFQDRM